MLLRREKMKIRTITNCHDGTGSLSCTQMLSASDIPGAEFAYAHDDILEPHSSIGEHTHTENEELYIILEGKGEMLIDGVPTAVGPGDICYTRRGHSHSLTAGSSPMRILVIATRRGGLKS